MSRSDVRRRTRTTSSPVSPSGGGSSDHDRQSTDAGMTTTTGGHLPPSFKNPYEEKKEEETGPSCPSTPPPPVPGRGIGARHERTTTTKDVVLLSSPAPTATTVVTSTTTSSSPLPLEPQDEGTMVGGRRRGGGPTNYHSDDIRYAHRSDQDRMGVPKNRSAPSSPESLTTTTTVGVAPEATEAIVDPSAVPAAAAASTAKSLSALPIPLPPRSCLTNPHLRYYRIVYRGVVALLSSASRNAPRSGVYLSYGDVFAVTGSHDDNDADETNDDDATCGSSSDAMVFSSGTSRRLSPRRSGSAATTRRPERPTVVGSSELSPSDPTLPPPRLPLLPTHHPRCGALDPSLVLRVDYVLTGGYANEGDGPNLSSSAIQQQWGYLFAHSSSGEAIVERIGEGSTSQQIPPAVSAGPWTYQIVSTSPVPTFTGPCADAPRTAAMLLPGSVHDVSLCFDHQYLRLHHRRGWFRAYREAPGDNGTVVKIPTAQLVRVDEASDVFDGNHGNNNAAADLSMTSHSTSSSYSTANTSFNTSFVSTASTQRHRDRRRHRPPRRTLDHERGDVHSTSYGPTLFPRHVTGPAGGKNSTGSALASSSPTRHQLDERCSVSLVSDDEGESSEQSSDEHVYLMRVLHPKGLKILDAPQYAASHLIHGSLAHQQRYASSSSSSSSVQPHRVFATFPPMHSNPVIVFDSHSKTRRLPTRVYFEARSLLQQTMVNGEGLVQLFDKTGWAMVPTPADVEMVAQSTLANGREWLRVLARSGLAVTNPPVPPVAPGTASAPQSPNSTRTATTLAAESTSDVASSVGSAILDVFRTPKTKPSAQSANLVSSEATVIPCGTMVQVERVVSGDFARLLGGQGWIPTALQGKPVCVRMPPGAAPEFRRGSFWFRVQSPRGVRVRIGPSRRAPSIKSASPGKDQRSTYFRFECGEFLRASEIVTLFADPNEEDGGSTTAAECYCKLYRNRHANLYPHLSAFESVPSLEAYTSPSEWVQVYHGEDLFLEECAQEPHIERHKTGGWKYQVLREVGVRKGPSFASESTGTLEPGDSITVNERVAPPSGYADGTGVPDEKALHWLRLKDGQGWVHDTCQDTGEALLVPHSLRHHNNKPKKGVIVGKRDEVAYNAIIARLFHPRDDIPADPKLPPHSR